MPGENKQRIDVAESDAMTKVINDLLNDCPLLEADDSEILFSTLGKDSGFGWFPISGVIIVDEKQFVTGRKLSTYNYPFYIIYRVGEPKSKQKMNIKEYLDDIGRWLEKQKIIVEGTEVELKAYPKLSDDREITAVARQTPAYLDNTNDNGVEDWAVLIALNYKKEVKGERI